MDWLSQQMKRAEREGQSQFDNSSKRCAICGDPAVGIHRHLLKCYCANLDHQRQIEEEWEQSDH